jgi:hypothetical protein
MFCKMIHETEAARESVCRPPKMERDIHLEYKRWKNEEVEKLKMNCRKATFVLGNQTDAPRTRRIAAARYAVQLSG